MPLRARLPAETVAAAHEGWEIGVLMADPSGRIAIAGVDRRSLPFTSSAAQGSPGADPIEFDELVGSVRMGSDNGAQRSELAITCRPWANDGTTLTIAGELDIAGLAALRRALQEALGAGHRHLVVDLSAATFLDCAALGELLQAVRPLHQDANAAVVFAGATGRVRRLLQVLRFDALIGTVESPEIAIAACRRHPITLPDGWRHA